MGGIGWNLLYSHVELNIMCVRIYTLTCCWYLLISIDIFIYVHVFIFIYLYVFIFTYSFIDLLYVSRYSTALLCVSENGMRFQNGQIYD